MTVVYTDHKANIGLAKATSMTTSSTDKLNLHLIQASEYLQRFNLDIRHKPRKQHIVPDTLSHLALTLRLNSLNISELNALHTHTYITSLVKMDSDFKKKLILGYEKDLAWNCILSLL